MVESGVGKRKTERRFHGTFELPGGQESFGELSGTGQNTILKLSSRTQLPRLRRVNQIHGTTLEGTKLTCVDCVISSSGRTVRDGVDAYHYANFFPHYVVAGDRHVDAETQSIRRISFTVTDVTSLFYDFDAFGFVIDASKVIDAVLHQQSKIRELESGDWPQIAYFTGKFDLMEVNTSFGKISASHRPISNTGGPNGVYIKNRIYISIEPESPITFDESIERALCVLRFLSMAAGREQAIKDIQIGTIDVPDDAHRVPPKVFWSYAPLPRMRGESHKPRPGDVPLDPIRRMDEFATVLAHWIERDNDWCIARNRYLGCLRKGNSYDVDRLVAAANMFDVLPSGAVPPPAPLPEDLAGLQAKFLAAFRALPPGPDRDSAISSIARLGKASLPKKVASRLQIIESKVGEQLPDLAYVLKMAIACRNHFVHGGSDNFNFYAAEPFVGFLTDALEFVFAASDLVEAGWDISSWIASPHAAGHSFARFKWGYKEVLVQFKQAMQ